MSGFIGNFEHNLDSKKRVFVPAKFRDCLGDSFIIRVKPTEYPHIECFTEDEFEKKIEVELAPYTDEFMREQMLFVSHSNAGEVTVDSQGRICLSNNILRYSKITKVCLFVGMRNYVQIWDPEIYNQYLDYVSKIYAREAQAAYDQSEKRREFMAKGKFLLE